MSKEIERIEAAYEERKKHGGVENSAANRYGQLISEEREKIYMQIIRKHFKSFSNIKLLEIGAGVGVNLDFFIKSGFLESNIYANELLPGRYEGLLQRHPNIHHYLGNAAELKIGENTMDMVFQSTVFTSILDLNLKRQIADKIFKLLKPGGIILWYDFTFDNPSNKNVKGIGLSEIRSLFPQGKISFKQKVTLAPPIGRRLPKMYKFLNAFPFLRTHIVVVIEK